MKILGPIPCINCGKPVWWDRTDGRFTLMEGSTKHLCAASGQEKKAA